MNRNLCLTVSLSLSLSLSLNISLSLWKPKSLTKHCLKTSRAYFSTILCVRSYRLPYGFSRAPGKKWFLFFSLYLSLSLSLFSLSITLPLSLPLSPSLSLSLSLPCSTSSFPSPCFRSLCSCSTCAFQHRWWLRNAPLLPMLRLK